jgi:hypothetical protein
MAIRVSHIEIENAATGEVELTRVYEAETFGDLSALFDMSDDARNALPMTEEA